MSYTTKINSIEIYAEALEMPVPVISFSSPNVTVNGHISIIVESSKIILSSPNVEIVSSHKQVIFSDIGNIVFPSNLGIFPGIWTLTSGIGKSILNKAGKFIFSDSNISISGHKTIVLNIPKELNFSSLPSVYVLEHMINCSSAEMKFISNLEDILTPFIENIPAKINFTFGDIIVVGDVKEDISFNMELSFFELNLFNGSSISIEAPEIDLECHAVAGTNGKIQTVFPKLSMNNYSGGYLQFDVLKFNDLNIQTKSSNIIYFDSQMQNIEMVLKAKQLNPIYIIGNIPRISLQSSLITGNILDFISGLSKINLTSNLVVGYNSDIVLQFPKLKSIIDSKIIGSGNLNMEFQIMQIELQSGDISEIILRYIHRRIR